MDRKTRSFKVQTIRKRRYGWRRFLFFFISGADEARLLYDGLYEMPEEIQKKFAYEIELAKKDLLIKRMFDRASAAYWLQWIQLALTIVGTIMAAHFKPDILLHVAFGGAGSTLATNIVRKISRQRVMRQLNGHAKVETEVLEKATETPIDEDPDAEEV